MRYVGSKTRIDRIRGCRWLGLAALAGAFFTVRQAMALPEFGSAVAVGDFSGDGGWHGGDLAIGAPYEDWSGSQTGSVTVYWRSPSGSNNWAYDWLAQDRLSGALFTGGGDGGLEDWDNFGKVMAVGDFDHDGYKDLALGVPYEDIGAEHDAGCVHVVYGAPAGSGPNGMPFRQNTVYLTRASTWAGLLDGVPQAYDNFGFSLAAGDFDGDGDDDLAVGAPGVTVNLELGAGAVFVFYSSGPTFPAAGAHTLIQGSPRSPGTVPQAGDSFGTALAAGNFNGDLNGTQGGGTGANGSRRIMDLAVSAIGQSVNGALNAGEVTVYYGRAANTFSTSNTWVVNQASLEFPEELDGFGYTLAAGDFNSTCPTLNPNTCTSTRQDDLAIGVPNEAVGNAQGAGLVHVLYGTPAGLSLANQQTWNSSHFSKPFLSTPVESWANFGASLAVGDVIGEPNGGCQGQACNPVELVIGEPYRDRIGAANSGRGYVLKGNAGGLLSVNHNFPFIEPHSYHPSSYYTFALAVGFIGSFPQQSTSTMNAADVLVGAPGIESAFVHYGRGDTVSQSQPLAFPWPW